MPLSGGKASGPPYTGRREVFSNVDRTEQGVSLGLIEAPNARDLTLWSRDLAEEYEAEHPGVSVLLDKSRSIAYHQHFVTAFPDIRFEVIGVIAEGDRVLIHWTARNPHRTAGHGHGRNHPPTRRGARESEAMLAEIRDGEMVRGWFYWCQLALPAQLRITEQPGLFPSAEAL